MVDGDPDAIVYWLASDVERPPVHLMEQGHHIEAGQPTGLIEAGDAVGELPLFLLAVSTYGQGDVQSPV